MVLEKLRAKNLDLIVINPVGGPDSDSQVIQIEPRFWMQRAEYRNPACQQTEMADAILDRGGWIVDESGKLK
jgi:hypothetical protein